MRTVLSVLALTLAIALPAAAADPALGVWQTQPDRKDLTSHIQIRQCGAKLCGRVIAAFDPSGKEVRTKNVGKELFWDMQPLGGGTYDGGTAWIPLLNVQARAKMALSGNRLKVTGCKGPVCDGQTWTKLR